MRTAVIIINALDTSQINPFKPEFFIEILIHYKTQIAVTILGLS